jgi:hypothetical protein
MTNQFIQMTAALVSAVAVGGLIQEPPGQTRTAVRTICRIDPQPDRHMTYKLRRLRVRKLAFGSYEV